MNISKIVVSSLVAVTLFAAASASAQTYYPSTNYTYSSTGCVNLTSDLSYGSRGTQVLQLQKFLVAQNYPGSGSWMETGYFGAATLAALRDFQQSAGISTTGVADSATRSAISFATCGIPGLGNTGYNNNYNYNQYPYTTTTNPYSYQYPYNTYSGSCGVYPYYYPCTTYNTAPTLTSLSSTYAQVGSVITVYGTGFDPINNTVYVGGSTLSNIPSSTGGTSLVFTVPSNASGVVSISVANSYGTSNALTLTTSGSPIVCGTYPYTTCGNPCGYAYGCPNTGIPTISYVSPNTGAVGTSVTVFGSGFSTTGNTVHFGNGIIANLNSLDGYSVSFTIPSTLSGYGYQPIGLGTYNISVSNSAGVVSNTVPFTITSLGTSGAPVISNVTGPTSLQTNTSGTWSVTINNPSGTYASVAVSWGDNNLNEPQASNQSLPSGTQVITFSHTYTTTGTYTITFTVSN